MIDLPNVPTETMSATTPTAQPQSRRRPVRLSGTVYCHKHPCGTFKFCNGLPVIGSAGLSLLQKSAAKVRTFAISFATERSHNPVCSRDRAGIKLPSPGRPEEFHLQPPFRRI